MAKLRDLMSAGKSITTVGRSSNMAVMAAAAATAVQDGGAGREEWLKKVAAMEVRHEAQKKKIAVLHGQLRALRRQLPEVGSCLFCAGIASFDQRVHLI